MYRQFRDWLLSLFDEPRQSSERPLSEQNRTREKRKTKQEAKKECERKWQQQQQSFDEKLRQQVAAGSAEVACSLVGPIDSPRYGNVGNKCAFCPHRFQVGEMYGLVSYHLDGRDYHPECWHRGYDCDPEFSEYEHTMRGGGWDVPGYQNPPTCNICKQLVKYRVTHRYTSLMKSCCHAYANNPSAWGMF